LVYYVHRQVGMQVPRTARDQYEEARRVSFSRLAPGDLVFFDLPGGRSVHVGVFVGEELFVHAPAEGRPVEYASLSSPHWRDAFLGGGRLL
jgi:cell wall-associated NlpC family hydrolase